MTPYQQAAPDLAALGFTCIPLLPHDFTQHQGRGKAPGEFRSGNWRGMSKWQRYRDSTPSQFELGLWSQWPNANIGLLMGTVARKDLHVVVLDFDAKDPDALDTLLRAAPASPMVKRGQKGESRFYLAPKTLKTTSYDGPDGRLIDRLTGFDTRQTVVPPSVHPDTGQPYMWLAGPVRADELPVLTDEDIEALEEALEQCGWETGGRAIHNRASRLRSDAPNDIDPDDIWSETKAAALGNLDAWVPALNLYGLRPARGGYEAVATWRASCSGRNIADRKRNLSIQRDGIKDFGTNDTYSAIDLVMSAKDCDQAEATDWLRVQLGLKDDGVVIALGGGASFVQILDNSEDDLPEPLRVKAPDNRPDVAIITPPEPQVSICGQLEADPFACPGLVGQIADWICDTALQPQRAAALLAALQVVGVAAGRTFGGPTKTGTHLYGLFLAPSGASKDHPLKCIDRLLRASTMGAHVGPGEYMSMSALVSRLNRQPLTISAIDEFGDYLARINGRKSSPHEKAITRTLRSAWGSSFDTMSTPEWAGRVGEPIFSPALSIFGVSTHESFFKGLDGDDVFNGFLNRFIIFTTMDRVEEVEPAKDKSIVPEEISNALVKIYTSVPPMSRATSHNAQSDGPLITVPWENGLGSFAHKAYLAYRQTCMRRDEDAVFYTRSAEIAQRLAMIRAIGIGGAAARITLEDMDWGIALADMSARDTVSMARDYMSETQHQGEAQRVVRCCKRSTWTAYRDVARALNNRMRAKDLRDILDGLVDAGTLEMREDRPEMGGHKIKSYRLA